MKPRKRTNAYWDKRAAEQLTYIEQLLYEAILIRMQELQEFIA